MKLPEINVKKILYAKDLSENARYAFAYAVSLANFYGAGLSRCCMFCRKFRIRWMPVLKGTSVQTAGKKFSSTTIVRPEKPLPGKEKSTWPSKKSWINFVRMSGQVPKPPLLKQTILLLSGEIRWNKFFHTPTKKTVILLSWELMEGDHLRTQ